MPTPTYDLTLAQLQARPPSGKRGWEALAMNLREATFDANATVALSAADQDSQVGWLEWTINRLRGASLTVFQSFPPSAQADRWPQALEQVVVALLDRGVTPLSQEHRLQLVQKTIMAGAPEASSRLWEGLDAPHRQALRTFLHAPPVAPSDKRVDGFGYEAIERESPWFRLVLLGQVSMLSRLMEDGLGDAHTLDSAGRPASFWVVHPPMFHLLDSHGMDWSCRDKQGRLAVQHWMDHAPQPSNFRTLLKSWSQLDPASHPALPAMAQVARDLLRDRLVVLPKPIVSTLMKAAGMAWVTAGTTLDGVPLAAVALRQAQQAKKALNSSLAAHLGLTGYLHSNNADLKWLLEHSALHEPCPSHEERSLAWAWTLDPAIHALTSTHAHLPTAWANAPEAQAPLPQQMVWLQAWTQAPERQAFTAPIMKLWWRQVRSTLIQPAGWRTLLGQPDDQGVPWVVSEHAPWRHENMFVADALALRNPSEVRTAFEDAAARRAAVLGTLSPTDSDAPLWFGVLIHEHLRRSLALNSRTEFHDGGVPYTASDKDSSTYMRLLKREVAFMEKCLAAQVRPPAALAPWLEKCLNGTISTRYRDAFDRHYTAWQLHWSLPQQTPAATAPKRVRL